MCLWYSYRLLLILLEIRLISLTTISTVMMRGADEEPQNMEGPFSSGREKTYR